MSIADQILRLQNDSTAIASAIAAKGVTVPSGSGYDDYASLIASIDTSGGSNTDFDAWLHDGDTHLWINIIQENQLEQQIRTLMIGTIDWGDGTTESVSVTTSTTFSHTYTATGKYRIDLIPTSGTFYLGGAGASYNVMGLRTNAYYRTGVLYQVEIGTKRMTSLRQYAFYYLLGLHRVYVPSTITSLENYAFAYCLALEEIIFEDSSTITTTSLTYTFGFCYALINCSNFIPLRATTMNTTYYYCYALTDVTLPSTLTSIKNNTLRNMYSLKYLRCLPTTPPTASSASVFTNLPSTCVIEVPADSLSAYQAADYWSTYADQMVGV